MYTYTCLITLFVHYRQQQTHDKRLTFKLKSAEAADKEAEADEADESDEVIVGPGVDVDVHVGN